MILRYFYDRSLAQASYLVGCAKTGEALIVDPARHVQPYLDAAEQEGLTIRHIAETHIHADFVSGSRELGAATEATIYLSNAGDEQWQYGYAQEPNVIPVHGGDGWLVGKIQVDVLHTPGHTPEHISLMITDTAVADKPIGVFTGDFLFVGDVGRPDLLESAAGMAGTADAGARQQFQTVERFKQMADYLQIWPGHGAGSAFGKALGAIPSTTLGYEKRFNPAFQFAEEDKFTTWLLADQPEAPAYFEQMKRVNQAGPALLKTLQKPVRMERTRLDDLLAEDAFVVDLRRGEAYAGGYLPATISIPASNSGFITYVGWYVDYGKPFYFIAPDADAVPGLLRELRAIGVDDVPAYATAEAVAGGTQSLPTISAHELAKRLPQNGWVVVDVRGASEYAAEHIQGAHNLPVGLLPRHLNELPRETPLIIHCASGYRAQIAASYLHAQGFGQALVMGESQQRWSEALPTASQTLGLTIN